MHVKPQGKILVGNFMEVIKLKLSESTDQFQSHCK
jgi:hypothetical protein